MFGNRPLWPLWFARFCQIILQVLASRADPASNLHLSPRDPGDRFASLTSLRTNSSPAPELWGTLGELVFTFPPAPINFLTEEDTHENSRLRRSAICSFRGRHCPAVSPKCFRQTHCYHHHYHLNPHPPHL